MNLSVKYTFLVLFFGVALQGAPEYCQRQNNNLHWDWDTINTDAINFPKNFLWGVATSAHQVEGNCTNNTFYAWEQEHFAKKTRNKDGQLLIQHLSENACDHWNRYKEDVQLIKALGVNTFRMSVEWSKIEPTPGNFDTKAIQHYRDVCQELVRNGIKPVITLHHYVEPLWFGSKGGFKKSKNIKYFVRFCKTIVAELQPYVHLWFTFNSPSAFALKSYYLGDFFPGEKSIKTAKQAFENMLEAHVQVYYAIKSLPNGHCTSVGILKNIYQLDPLRPSKFLDKLGSFAGNKYQMDDIFYSFFTKKSSRSKYRQKYKQRRKSLDFIGLNYYGHAYMHRLTRVFDDQELPTDNPNYHVYPEGLYRAICTLSEKVARPLSIPIYITENGIATQDDKTRDLFLRRYLFSISKAIKEGHDVRGYIHWSLLDNYEWGSYDKKYGVYAVNFETQQRTLKPGASYFIDIVRNFT